MFTKSTIAGAAALLAAPIVVIAAVRRPAAAERARLHAQMLDRRERSGRFAAPENRKVGGSTPPLTTTSDLRRVGSGRKLSRQNAVLASHPSSTALSP
jgi:hypothetical protein